MKDKKSTKKQKIIKFLGISSVIISLVLSSMALYYVSENNDTKSGETVKLHSQEQGNCMELMVVRMEDLVFNLESILMRMES